MGADADIIRRITDEAFVGGNASVIDELVADDYVEHDAPPGVPASRDGFRQMAEMVTAAFTDRKMEFDDYLETSDGRVVENWAMTGTHTAEAFGVRRRTSRSVSGASRSGAAPGARWSSTGARST